MADATIDIGGRIREARVHRGLTLRDIADTTKISTQCLDAIERNQFSRLPGGVFRRAYVKMFAAEVGLKADELAREYVAAFEAEDVAEAEDAAPAAAARGVVLRPRLLLAGLAGLVILIGGSFLISGIAGGSPPASVGSEGQAVRPDVPAVNAVAAKAEFLRLAIRANGPSWVTVVADGKRAVYRLMLAGEREGVEARHTIALRVGDAGAVTYSINGVEGRPLGAKGEPVTLEITRENYQELLAETDFGGL